MLEVRIVLIKSNVNPRHISTNINLISNTKLSNHLSDVMCDINTEILPLHRLLLKVLGILSLINLLTKIDILVVMMLLD